MNQVRLGFEVGSGAPVEIPLAHTFVSGQTQQSGKTTTLRAIVERSGRSAIAFVTKRGEELDGRRIRPYLPRRSEQPIHWRLVEAMLASALDQKRLQSLERLWLIKAAKGAHSLDDVQGNIRRLLAKTKSDRSTDVYTLLDEYLELVVPQMRSLQASETLDLQPGLNVIDLSGLAVQTQSMVIRAALERINTHETNVLTVLPEAWEFAPRGRSAPAKDEAIAMSRKGAAPKVQNFLLVDSQDIAGVENVVRQACSVWLIGVQRELNEVKRAVQMMPVGVKRPKADDVATLQLGQFYACWGAHAVKVYVQPAWMTDDQAVKVATGVITVGQMVRHQQSIEREAAAVERRFIGRTKQEETVNAAEAQALKDENNKLREENAELRRRLDALKDRGTRQHQPGPRAAERHATGPTTGPDVGSGAGHRREFTAAESFDNEQLYQAIKARLVEELPSDPRVIEIVMARPEIRVKVERHVLKVDGRSLRGRIARLITEDYFSQARTSANVLDELLKRGADRPSNIELGNEMKALCDMGFFTRDNKWYSLVPGAKVNVDEAA